MSGIAGGPFANARLFASEEGVSAMIRRVFTPLAVVGLLFSSSGFLFAQALGQSAIQQVQALLQAKLAETATQQKLDSKLHFAGQLMRGLLSAASIPATPPSSLSAAQWTPKPLISSSAV